VEVDLAAVRHNVRVLKELLGSDRFLWTVLKAQAYGHGAVPVARAVGQAGADGIAVSCLAEAAELRRAGITTPLLVLGPGEPRSAGRAVRLDIIQTACTEEMMRALSRAAQREGRAARVHLKVDTGMGRLGVRPHEAAGFARCIESLPGVQLEGTFSHLATAESEDPEFALEQFKRFQEAMGGIRAAGMSPGLRHLANSAATLRFPEMRLDGVRAGLLIYGIMPEAPDLEHLDLRPALTWKTRLSFMHELPPGSPVSYGATYVTSRKSVVGVLPLGYADGYPRRGSNRARVLVRGRPCPVIGVVCMDHVMVDVTPAGDAQRGEEVVLLGRQGNGLITANQLAQWADTVVHEITTVIGRRVRRIYLDPPDPRDPGFGPACPT
jgi:alanine racemase